MGKFQRELESAESRAEEAESCLNSFRSQQRVFAAAAESKSREVNEVEREVVVRKNVTNVSASSANVSRTAIQTSSRVPAPPPWQRPPAPHGTTGQGRLSPLAGREAWPELLQSGREASAGQAQCSGTS